MTYAMGKVIYEVERMSVWVRNLITYSDLEEVAKSADTVTRQEIRDRLAVIALERRGNR